MSAIAFPPRRRPASLADLAHDVGCYAAIAALLAWRVLQLLAFGLVGALPLLALCAGLVAAVAIAAGTVRP
jgi:hypothetical protein